MGRTRVSPVSESDGFMVWATPSHQDDTKDDESDNGDDFQAREPEFHLSKNPCSQEVDGEDENQENRHVDSRVRGRICMSER